MEDMDNSANLSTRATQSLQDNVLPLAELIKSTASLQKQQSEAQKKFQEDVAKTVTDLSLKVDKHSDGIEEVKQKFGTTGNIEEIAKDTKSVLDKLTVTQKYSIAAANLTRSLKPKTRCTYELRICGFMNFAQVAKHSEVQSVYSAPWDVGHDVLQVCGLAQLRANEKKAQDSEEKTMHHYIKLGLKYDPKPDCEVFEKR